ncbi:hypothetical protein UE94_036810, partial [Burkholderia cenocepacia]|uniref:hypothetical protein n=1 Tax=Burkholderia cenocepacia TaxID=95486 RepID=UPI00222D938B
DEICASNVRCTLTLTVTDSTQTSSAEAGNPSLTRASNSIKLHGTGTSSITAAISSRGTCIIIVNSAHGQGKVNPGDFRQ